MANQNKEDQPAASEATSSRKSRKPWSFELAEIDYEFLRWHLMDNFDGDIVSHTATHPATDADCLEYFTALKKRKHISGYGPGENPYWDQNNPNGYFNIANEDRLLEARLRIPYANPPWSGAPPQLSLELQEALHHHMTTHRSRWMQYYARFFVPPAYYSRFFDCFENFLAPYYPPSLHEISEKAIRFYLVELYPYVLTLEPAPAFWPVRRSEFKTDEAARKYHTPNFPNDCNKTRFIKDGFVHILELMTNSFETETIFVSPVDRYIRGILAAHQSELTIIVLEAMMASLRTHIPHKHDASIRNMSIEIKWWILCVNFVANRARSERIEALLLKYLKEDGYRRKVVRGIRKSSLKHERARARLEDPGPVRYPLDKVGLTSGWVKEPIIY